MSKKIIYILIFLFSFNFTLSSKDIDHKELEVFKYAYKAYKEVGIRPYVLMSISKVESNFNMYAINVAGKSYYPTSKAMALFIVKEAEALGLSYDVGYMQINNKWFKHFGISAEDVIEPYTNFVIGAKILKYELERTNYSHIALGYYHSKTTFRAKDYIIKVLRYLDVFKDKEPILLTQYYNNYRQTKKDNGQLDLVKEKREKETDISTVSNEDVIQKRDEIFAGYRLITN